MKKRSLFSLLVALALMLSAVAPALAEDVIKIGGIGVLSGDYGKYGLAVKEGVDLYVKQINAAVEVEQRMLFDKDNRGADKNRKDDGAPCKPFFSPKPFIIGHL